jgi:streptomycin 6-kinase
VPARLLDAALASARDAGESAGTLLLSDDLHYDNVLRGQREPWLMIDPKPVSGDPEFGVIPLLWNRFSELDGERELRERLAALVDAAELDPERTRAWTLLRAVDNWLWELNAGNPGQAQVCAAIAALLS